MLTSVLIIDDDQLLLHALSTALRAQGFHVSVADTVTTGLNFLAQKHFDLILLDRLFPQFSGFEIVEYIHHTKIPTPILMISGQFDSESRIEALEHGADDFLAKPFNQKELLLKVDKLLYRHVLSAEHVVTTSYFTLNIDNGVVAGTSWATQLRRKEFQILSFLIEQKNKVVPKDMLIEKVWGIEETPLDSTIDVHIRRVRLQIKDKQKTILRTLYGRGYQFYDPSN